MTEVAERASVDRTTFYKHAVDPESLLVSTLRDELNELLSEFESSYQALPRENAYGLGLRMIVGHVFNRREIYARNFINESNTPLILVVRVHLRENIPTFIRNRFFDFPDELLNNEFAIAMASRMLAAGFVGALAEWLSSANDLDVDNFLRVYYKLAPAWHRPRVDI